MADSASITELWRYPVKSMRGEQVDRADVTANGLAGDRGYAVVDARTGKVGSAKHPRLWASLLQCTARYVDEPVAGGALPPVEITLPEGATVRSDDAAVDERLSAVAGRPVTLASAAIAGATYLAVWPEWDGVMPDASRAQWQVEGDEADGTLTEIGVGGAAPGTFFDVAALHILMAPTLRHLNEAQPSSRFRVERYRPNIVLDADVPAFTENGWTGSTMALGGGGATAAVLMPTMRCIMTTLAQGDLPRDNEVLRTVTRENRVELGGMGTWSCVGAYALVASPGEVTTGDDVPLPAG